MRSLHIAWLYFRVAAMNELQYRANFVLQIFQAMVALATGLISLWLIFSHTNTLHGWTGPQVLALMGIFTIIGALVAGFIQPNMQQLMDDIQQGNFDYVLTKPEDAQLLASLRRVEIWQFVDALTGVIILGVALVKIGSQIGLAETIGFFVVMVMGATLIYCFWLTLTTIAFWVVRMDQIADLFEGAYAAGRYPVGIYPGWLQFGLTFLIPVAFAITVPAEALTGRLDLKTVALMTGVTLFFMAVTRTLWRFGLKRYSGASA